MPAENLTDDKFRKRLSNSGREMAKRKKPGKSRKPQKLRLAPNLSRAALDSLVKAMDLSDEGRREEAREILEKLNCRYPDRIEILGDLYNQCVQLNDRRGIERSAARLLRLHPDDPGVTLALAGAYVFAGRMALAVKTFQRFIECWPDHDEIDYALDTLPTVRSIAKQRIVEAGFTGDDAFELAELHEESLSLLDQGDYKAARAANERLLSRSPGLELAYNSLSLIAMCENKLEEAMEIAEGVLHRDGRNVHALANMIRFLVMSGQVEKARGYADRLKAIDLPVPDVWIKKAEALSFLGDDSGVLSVLPEVEEEERRFPLPSAAAMVFHFAAVATMRMKPFDHAAEKEAKRHWEHALELWAGLELAEANLEDLQNPIEERHVPWPFHLHDWVRREVVYELEDELRFVSEDDKALLVRVGKRFLARHPELKHITPILLERGDPAGRSFAITVATIGQTPELLSALRNFVLGRNGPDLFRIRSTRVLLETEWLEPGPQQMWLKGQWDESLLMGVMIDGEPIKNVGKKAEPLVNQALHLLRAEDGEKAEAVIRQALLIEPENPMLINNLIKSIELQGRRQEVEEMAEDLYERFPDYLFGRTNIAILAIQKGDLDRASECLKPLYSRKRMHFSEYGAFASAQIELALASGDRKTAKQWFENWDRIDPDNQQRERFRARVKSLSWKDVIIEGRRQGRRPR
jgi:tetratricopeptide (TPR) repeat protein